MATAEDLEQTAKEVHALGRRIVSSTADVRDVEQLRSAVDLGIAELGRLDIVVANASVCKLATSNSVTAEAWRDVIDTNLTGAWNTMVAAAPHPISHGGGSIVCTGSTCGS